MKATTANFNFIEVENPGYLGRAEVVQKLVQDFVHDDVLGASRPEVAMSGCRRMSVIFSGKDKHYTPIPGWKKDLTRILHRQFQIDPSQSPEDMLTTFFLDLTEAIYKLVKELDGPELDRRIDMTATYYAQALLGIKGDYAWAAK